MPDGHPIKEAIRKIIQDEIAAIIQASGVSPPVGGVVSEINDDGTIQVNTQDGQTLQVVGTPIVRVKGEQVIVITSQDNTQVAI